MRLSNVDTWELAGCLGNKGGGGRVRLSNVDTWELAEFLSLPLKFFLVEIFFLQNHFLGKFG